MESGGMKIFGLSTDQEACLRARGKFAEEYCKIRGWPVGINELTMDQILEIRSQDGWKNPIITKTEAN